MTEKSHSKCFRVSAASGGCSVTRVNDFVNDSKLFKDIYPIQWNHKSINYKDLDHDDEDNILYSNVRDISIQSGVSEGAGDVRKRDVRKNMYIIVPKSTSDAWVKGIQSFQYSGRSCHSQGTGNAKNSMAIRDHIEPKMIRIAKAINVHKSYDINSVNIYNFSSR